MSSCQSAGRGALDCTAIHPGSDDVVAFLHVGDLGTLGDDHTSRLMPQQGGIDGRRATVRGLGRAMNLV